MKKAMALSVPASVNHGADSDDNMPYTHSPATPVTLPASPCDFVPVYFVF